ncbi:MAG TPA: hypothetical protein VKZ47_06495 [Acidimicrobiia bacterium]|nr:hypothetical protein [Acidimicrobiia bacterium]
MGDPACWMHEMCLECGTISEERGPDEPCPSCGADPAPTAKPASAPC